MIWLYKKEFLLFYLLKYVTDKYSMKSYLSLEQNIFKMVYNFEILTFVGFIKRRLLF